MSQTQQIKVSDKVQGVVERDTFNKVIERREIAIKLFHIGVGTPSREELRKAIAQFLGKPEELVVVRKIFTKYGAGISEARVHIYDKKENLEKYEPKHLLERGTGKKQGGEQSGEQKQG
ncbi:MAG: 30S ribosomal protein S24e [Candidatus Aramenus sp.]|jgi:small subunit ribosomal protein S24e|nr:30S ribosomal protein S24e [Candidatus Aramenus sp.]